MEHPYPVVEFEAEISPDGMIRIPETLLTAIPDSRRIVLRITLGSVLPALRERGVTEQEIETITRRQHEERESVIQFLQAEGALAGDGGFQRRASAIFNGA